MTEVELKLNSENDQVVLKDTKDIQTNIPNDSSQHLLQAKSRKVRKPQTDEEFQTQKNMFFKTGPTLNTENWLYNEGLNDLDPTRKTDRVRMLHACEKAYFQRNYHKCLSLIKFGEKLFGVQLDDEIQKQKAHDAFDSSKKIRKSAKVERHIIEIMHIKEACLEKLSHLNK